MQDQLDKELQELDKRLQQKEVLVRCLYYFDLCLLSPANTIPADVVMYPQSGSPLFCALIHLVEYNYTSFSCFKRKR